MRENLWNAIAISNVPTVSLRKRQPFQRHTHAKRCDQRTVHAYMFAAMIGTPVHVLPECLNVYVLSRST